MFYFLTQPSSQQHQTLIIEEFEPDVFRQLIEYIHTGCVTLQPRTLLGKFCLFEYVLVSKGYIRICITTRMYIQKV